MSLVKRSTQTPVFDPARELQEMSSRISDMLARTFSWPNFDRETLASFDWAPSCNISEDESAYHVEADLPQVKKEDIKVELKDSLLSLSGERKEDKEQRGNRIHRVESSYGTFLRRFTLPVDIDEANAQAEFKDGVLRITVPKAPQKARSAHEVKVR